MDYKTFSVEQTKKLASKISQEYKNKGGVIFLIGDLGSGKTVFAQGFARGLGIKEKIISPTFILIRQHKIPKLQQMFYHIDLYRLDHQIEIEQLGLKDLTRDKNIVVIEWADKIKKTLKPSLTVIIKKISPHERLISLNK